MTPSLTSPSPVSWAFGPYTLDSQGHLRLGPTPLHLPPLQRRLLLALVRQKGQVLSRENLLQEVWGHEHVSEVSISRTVHGLRRVFADGPLGSGVIRTIYGGGYRMEVPIHASAPGQEGPQPDGGARFPTAQTLSEFVEGLIWVRHRDPRQLGRAERHLRSCLESAPDFTPAILQLAATLLAQYRWGLISAESLEPMLEGLLHRAEASSSMAAEVLVLRVEALSLLQWQPDLAEARFASWLPSQLPEGAAQHSWARHLLATGQPGEALRLLEPHLTPENPDGWMLAATAWWMRGEYEKASQSLQHQLDIDGRLVAARLLLALVLADSGRSSEALKEVEASGILTDPTNELQAVAVLVFALCGKPTLREDRLQAELSRARQERKMMSLWGLAALALGEEEAASDLLEQAVRHRCGLAPFLHQIPGLQRHGNSPALGRFQAAMTNRFRRTF